MDPRPRMFGLFVTMLMSSGTGCGSTEPVGEDGMVTTNPGSGGTSDGSGDGDGDGDGEVKIDFGPAPDIMLDDCTVMWTDPMTLDAYPECAIVLDEAGCDDELYWGCIPGVPGQTCAQLCPDGNCIGNWYNCVDDWPIDYPPSGPLTLCGPYELDGLCCSLAEFTQCPITTNAR